MRITASRPVASPWYRNWTAVAPCEASDQCGLADAEGELRRKIVGRVCAELQGSNRRDLDAVTSTAVRRTWGRSAAQPRDCQPDRGDGRYGGGARQDRSAVDRCPARLHPWSQHGEDRDRLANALQAQPPAADEVGLDAALGEATHGLGDEHLVRPRSGADARGDVDDGAHVGAVDLRHLAGMDAHADPDGALRTALAGMRAALTMARPQLTAADADGKTT